MQENQQMFPGSHATAFERLFQGSERQIPVRFVRAFSCRLV